MEEFEIFPTRGYGTILFGVNQEQGISTRSFGKPELTLESNANSSDLQEFAEQFGFSLEDVEAIENIQSQQEPTTSVFYLDSNLRLTYKDDDLYEIQISKSLEKPIFRVTYFLSITP